MHWIRLVFALLAVSACGLQQVAGRKDSCKPAMEAHRFALDMLRAISENRSSSNPNIGFVTNLRKAIASIKADQTANSDLLQLFPSTSKYAWGNAVVQLALSRAVHAPVAAIGEVVYICNSILQAEQALPANATPTAYATIWSKAWLSMAGQLINNLGDVTDEQARRARMLRAFNYMGTGSFGNPGAADTLDVYSNATDLFYEALELYRTYPVRRFKVPYNNGTVEAELDAFFVTPFPSGPVPTMITYSHPFYWKELSFLHYGLGALRRNYAVVFFDVPGQGFSLHHPPYLRTDTDHSRVLNTLLDAMEFDEQISEQVDFERVFLLGLGTAGWSGGRACAGTSARLAACVLNPGWLSARELLLTGMAARLYTPFVRVATDAPSTFPETELVQHMLKPVENILEPLLTVCEEGSGAAPLFEATFMPGAEPDVVSTPMQVLGLSNVDGPRGSLMWHAYRRVAMEFPDVNVTAIDVPVVILGGSSDIHTSLSQQPQRFYSLLTPDIKSQSVLRVLTPETGGAAPYTAGATPLVEEIMYSALQEILAKQGGTTAG